MLITIVWIGCATAVVCWATGVYNRLVRLRADITESLKVWQDHVLDKKVSNDLQNQDVQLEVKIQIAKSAHDASVSLYNQAIKQFPARFIAALFSFRPYIHNIGKPE